MRFHNFTKEILGDPACIAALQLLRHHQQLTGRELARLAGVSQFKMRSVLSQLMESGLLRMSHAGRSHLYSLNSSHFLVQHMEPIFELEANIFEIFGTWVMERIHTKPRSLILYGSIARNEERPDSDVDLLFVYSMIRSEEEMLTKIQECLEEGPQVFGNRMSPLLTTVTALKTALKKKDPLFRRILKEGIAIAGASMTELIA